MKQINIQHATAVIDRHIDFYEIDEKERCLVNNVLELVKKNNGRLAYENLIQDFEMQSYGIKTILI